MKNPRGCGALSLRFTLCVVRGNARPARCAVHDVHACSMLESSTNLSLPSLPATDDRGDEAQPARRAVRGAQPGARQPHRVRRRRSGDGLQVGTAVGFNRSLHRLLSQARLRASLHLPCLCRRAVQKAVDAVPSVERRTMLFCQLFTCLLVSPTPLPAASRWRRQRMRSRVWSSTRCVPLRMRWMSCLSAWQKTAACPPLRA